jgi:hypothetical protein
MINYDKPATSNIISYSGTIPSIAFKTMLSQPVTVSPVITDGYIQLVKFTIAIGITNVPAPANFDLLIVNTGTISGGMTLSSVSLTSFNIAPVYFIYEFNMDATSNWIYENSMLPNEIKVESTSDDINRNIADAKYTLLYTKYTI